MEDEVFEVDEFAVDPEGGAGVGEVLAFEEAGTHGRAGDTLVETGEGAAGLSDGFQQYLEQIRWHQGFLFPVIHDSLPA
nr:hypothetical protein RFYW14_04007 [Pseudorhizobium flavum]